MLSVFIMHARAAGVSFPTRVLYQEKGQYGVNVQINNRSDTDYLLQSRVVMGAQSNQNAPFMVLPPLTKLASHNDTVLVIRRTGGELPANKESLFYLSVRMIPGETRQKQPGGMQLKMVTDYRMRVFYRPKGIKNDKGDASALAKLTVRRQGDTLILTNPTPYYVTLARLSQGSYDVSPERLAQPVPPLGEARYHVDMPLTARPITVWVFDELGFTLPSRQIDWVK